MVAAANPLGSLAGLRILMQGGNAVDAAVATAAALNVAEPYMSGIGGVGYMHIYSARDQEHKVLDYIGLTPAAADLSCSTGRKWAAVPCPPSFPAPAAAGSRPCAGTGPWIPRRCSRRRSSTPSRGSP